MRVEFIGRPALKRPSCELLIDPDFIYDLLVNKQSPDAVWKAWIHESVHARAPFRADWRSETAPHLGYEEALTEFFARAVMRRAGLSRSGEGYDYYAQSFSVLARAMGVGDEDLARGLFAFPVGAVRENFLAVVERLRSENDAQPLSEDQRQRLQELADEVFATSNHARHFNLWDGVKLWLRIQSL